MKKATVMLCLFFLILGAALQAQAADKWVVINGWLRKVSAEQPNSVMEAAQLAVEGELQVENPAATADEDALSTPTGGSAVYSIEAQRQAGPETGDEATQLAQPVLAQQPYVPVKTKLDAYFNIGKYWDNDDGDGYYVSPEIRCRPFWHGKINYGLFGKFIYVNGDTKTSSYDSKEFVIGPDAKYYGVGWDTSVKPGLSWLWSESEGFTKEYQSSQTDVLAYLNCQYSNYWRRRTGKSWLAQTNASFNLLAPFSTKHEHSWRGRRLEPKPYDNQLLELSLTQDVYDFYFSRFFYGGKNYRLTPGAELGLGWDYGHNANYFLAGAQIMFSRNGYDLAKMYYHRKVKSGAADVDALGVWLDIAGVYDTWIKGRKR